MISHFSHGYTTLSQKLSWAKALFYNIANCHGLKPVAIDRKPSRDFSPFFSKISYTLFS
jgi:hypothetical protein